jgi:hypothetical protein
MVSGDELDGNGHENQKNGEENVYMRLFFKPLCREA